MAGLREPLFPLRPRRERAVLDGFISNLAADRFPLEQLASPRWSSAPETIRWRRIGSDTERVTISKISFKPTSRRSSHAPAGQDRTRMCLTRGRVTCGQQTIRPGGTGFRHPQSLRMWPNLSIAAMRSV